MPSNEMSLDIFETGMNILDLFSVTELCSSKSEARRLVKQNGAAVNGEKITDPDAVINSEFIKDGEMILKAGKKRFFRIIIK
jgi:tyrosyl-tRNA synthetase